MRKIIGRKEYAPLCTAPSPCSPKSIPAKPEVEPECSARIAGAKKV